MLQVASRALCDRPGDSPEQRDALTRQLVHATFGLEPRDGLEYMMATMVFGHYHMILDATRAALCGRIGQAKIATRGRIVGLDRAMLGYIREMRLVRRRPRAAWAEDVQREAEAAMASAAPPGSAGPEAAADDANADQAMPAMQPAAPTRMEPTPVTPDARPPEHATALGSDPNFSGAVPWTAADAARRERSDSEFQNLVAAITAAAMEARPRRN
jgi:hypothetical protein